MGPTRGFWIQRQTWTPVLLMKAAQWHIKPRKVDCRFIDLGARVVEPIERVQQTL